MALLGLRKNTVGFDIEKFLNVSEQYLLDHKREFQLILASFLARGHILIEDKPGMGKTTLVKVFAKLVGLDFKRVQFTSDLLPTDLLGVSIFQPKESEFLFKKGPIFCQLLLADELNRASPKTQSACLQAMEEKTVSVDGKNYALPQPFFLIATQNPNESIGTYPLPESQLDRFSLKISLGHISEKAEKKLLKGELQGNIDNIEEPICSHDQITAAMSQVEDVQTSDALIDYQYKIIQKIRHTTGNLSPRVSLSYINLAKAWAYIHGRNNVIPSDLQEIAYEVTHHRIGTENGKQISRERMEELISSIEV